MPSTGASISHAERRYCALVFEDAAAYTADRCVAAKQLPLGTDVEIECIAVLP